MKKPERINMITDAEWEAMDEKTQRYMAARARPGESKTVNTPKGPVHLRAGFCPCDECGHTYMWECEEADCRCGPCHWTCS